MDGGGGSSSDGGGGGGSGTGSCDGDDGGDRDGDSDKIKRQVQHRVEKTQMSDFELFFSSRLEVNCRVHHRQRPRARTPHLCSRALTHHLACCHVRMHTRRHACTHAQIAW